MINSRVIDNNIRMSLSKNQTLNIDQFKRLFRLGMRLSNQHEEMPIIVDTGRNVNLTEEARLVFNRLNSRCIKRILVIISV